MGRAKRTGKETKTFVQLGNAITRKHIKAVHKVAPAIVIKTFDLSFTFENKSKEIMSEIACELMILQNFELPSNIVEKMLISKKLTTAKLSSKTKSILSFKIEITTLDEMIAHYSLYETRKRNNSGRSLKLILNILNIKVENTKGNKNGKKEIKNK